MNERLRRLVARAVLPVAAAAGLAACGARDGQPDPDGVVRIAIGEPASLVPTNADEQSAAQVLSALFTPLVGVDAAGRPHGLAAESVVPSDDSRVWTIKLREGFTFHNGEPVTADSYIRAWNHGAYRPNNQRNGYYFRRIKGYPALHPPAGQRPAARKLSGLAKVDDRTFTVTLTEPFGEFAQALAAPAFYPLPAAAFDGDGRLRDGFEEAPIGNGPFRMVGGWQRGSRIEVERYDLYAGDPARTGGVEFVIYPEPADPYPDLLAGELDIVPEIPAGHLGTVESDLGDRFRQLPASTFHFLAFPGYQAELANPEVRRAISMAIDRDEIAFGIFRGTQTPARSFVPPVVPGARPDSCGTACSFDPVSARALYAQAGGPPELTITYNLDGDHQDWIAATCDQLRTNLRVDCVPVAVPTFTDLLSTLEAKEPVGIVRLAWKMDYPSMESYLGPIFSADGSANVYGYRNPDFDALVDAGSYRQAEEILARDLPVIPLRFDEHAIGHSPRVRGLSVTRFDLIDLTTISLRDLGRKLSL